jgi:hypothetical protein
VVSFADRVKLDPESGRIDLELQKTRVERKEGIPEPPLFLPWFLDRDYPVNAVWKLLPWNKEGRPPRRHTSSTSTRISGSWWTGTDSTSFTARLLEEFN